MLIESGKLDKIKLIYLQSYYRSIIFAMMRTLLIHAEILFPGIILAHPRTPIGIKIVLKIALDWWWHVDSLWFGQSGV